MKKSVILTMLAVLVSLAYPFYITIKLQTAPPEDDWSRAVDVLSIDDPQAGYQSVYPYALVDLPNGELACIYYEYGALILKRITAGGQIVSSIKLAVTEDTPRQFAVSQSNKKMLGIYWRTGQDIAYITYQIADHTVSDIQLLGFKAKGIDSAGGDVIAYDDKQILIFSEVEQTQTIPIKQVVNLKAARQDNTLHLFYTTRNQDGYRAYYQRRNVISNQVQTELLYSAQKEQIWGDVQQVIVKGKTVGALYSRNSIVDQQIDRALVHVVIDDGVVKNHVYRGEHISHLGQMVSIDDQGFNMVSLLNDGVGIDYYRWHTKTGIDQRYRLTNSKVLDLYPHYIKTDHYDYFYWLDIGANQKVLRMSTNDPAVVAATTKPMTIHFFTAASILFFSGLLTIVITAFVPQLLFSLPLIYAYFHTSQRPGTSRQKQRQLLKLFIGIFLIYFAAFSWFYLLRPMKHLHYSLVPVNHPLILLAISVLILALSAYIAKLHIKGDFDNHRVLWYALFVLISMLLICINLLIYQPIDLMLYRL